MTLGRGSYCSGAAPFSPSISTSTWKIIRAKSDQIVFIRSEKSSNASFL